MANKTHAKILYEGTMAWNIWRDVNPQIIPDLSRSAYYDLKCGGGINFAKTNFDRAIFNSGNFDDGNFTDCSLYKTLFENVDLQYADFSNSNLQRANFINCRLNNAKFTDALLEEAVFRESNLEWVNFGKADLRSTAFLQASVRYADFNSASLGGTAFADANLHVAKGLETILHRYRSSIGIDTILNSQGDIPQIFLRGIGLPDEFITYLPSLMGKAFEFYTCFISYSSKNQEFVDRIYSDLQNAGIRCWFAHEDMKIGDKIRPAIDQAIRLRDKLLIVLSEESIDSGWVESEVETAFEEERKRNQLVLFPVRIDNNVMETDKAWAAEIRRTRHIGDFSNWKSHDFYSRALERLLRDLKH